ncbi:hypothetical protein [Anaerorhabdus sp.]|uniref:hypothetical protein n=1 Tax=Anaerorhabdus sp. TaxID=1872524 RepID=UPI002B216DD7|nr:hypothetical protein [Anaerorhabdus sp.]MEA4875290.1 hypothetical protein [Anaerorhabdus sp.]
MNDDIKEKIAYLIEYNRELIYKKNKNTNYRILEFIKLNNMNFIDSRTYHKMINGKILYDDDIYFFFLKKLNLLVIDERNEYSELNKLCVNCTLFYKNHDNKAYKQSLEILDNFLEKRKNYIYFKELYFIVHSMHRNYESILYEDITNIEEFIKLQKIFPLDFQPILADFIFAYYLHADFKNIESFKVYYFSTYETDYVKFNNVIYLTRLHQIIAAFRVLETINYEKSNSIEWKLDCLIAKFNLLILFDREKSRDVINEIKKLINVMNLDKSTEANTYYNILLAYYASELYSEAYEITKYLIGFENYELIDDIYVLHIYLASKLNKEVIGISWDKKSNKPSSILLNYFDMKKAGFSNKDCEKFLLDSDLEKFSKIVYRNILIEELNYLGEKNRSYSRVLKAISRFNTNANK